MRRGLANPPRVAPGKRTGETECSRCGAKIEHGNICAKCVEKITGGNEK